MLKTYYHNQKSSNKKNFTQSLRVGTKSFVDINILLNRVKIEKKNETRRKIIFFSLITISLSLFVTFIIIVK